MYFSCESCIGEVVGVVRKKKKFPQEHRQRKLKEKQTNNKKDRPNLKCLRCVVIKQQNLGMEMAQQV